MPRGARLESESGYYHVMMRGNNRERIFSQAADKEFFLTHLQDQVNKENITVAAYCLMDNHVHLLIHANINPMSDALKSINIKFAKRYNGKLERVGHVFQDRYKSEVISSDEQLIHVLRYIHNNPVKAQLTSRPADYKWSSYNSYISKKDKIIGLAEIEFIFSLFSNSIKQYEDFHLNEDIYEFLETKEDLEQQREATAQSIIRQYCKTYEAADAASLEKDILEQLIVELLKKSFLPHRRIAEITGSTRGKIHLIAKKLDSF